MVIWNEWPCWQKQRRKTNLNQEKIYYVHKIMSKPETEKTVYLNLANLKEDNEDEKKEKSSWV